MIYRVKQFFQGLSAHIKEGDRCFIAKYLNQEEQALFYQLRRNEQYHSLKVAYGCFGAKPKNRRLIRAALLHDIGKLGSNLNLINKSLVVLAEGVRLKSERLPKFLQRAMYYKKQHPDLGCRLLQPYKLDAYEYLLIKNHHLPSAEEPPGIRVLQYYDNKF